MKILVTGGVGYIGSHTVLELLNAGFEVVVVDNLSNAKITALERVELLSGKQVPFYREDILNEEGMAGIFAQHKIDAVIHFAGLKAVGESVEQPWKYYFNNVTGTLKLLKVMEQAGVFKLVFSSSATVYGQNTQMPLVETMTRQANSPYGQTKLMIEQILEDLAVADDRWSIATLRYFNPIGAHESGMIGEDPNGIPNNLMPFITQVASGKLAQLKVFGDDYATHDGTGVRDYIHVIDLALGHLAALNYLNEHHGVHIFNLGTGVGYSVLDVVHSFEQVNDVTIPYQVVERRSGDVEVCYADASKAKRELHWQTTKTLDDMCRDAFRWQQKNPRGY
jgi:UDP-glucose 4-epimerase